jgi:hypothetical protein
MNSSFLSKTNYLAGLRCARLLWHLYNAPAKIPPPDQHASALLEQGRRVGELAKRLFPGGIEVSGEAKNFAEVLERSRRAVAERKSLLEPGFAYRNAFSRADVLSPVRDGRWDIIEVKSATKVKEEYLHDLAFQWYVYKGAGVKIRKCFVLHVNKNYVRRGAIDPERLFTRVDVTKHLRPMLVKVPRNIRKMQTVIGMKERPERTMNPMCGDPDLCPLSEVCWSFLPENNVFTLHGLKATKAFEWGRRNVLNINDLPGGYPLTARQNIQRETLRRGEPHIDRKQIRTFLSRLKYPLYFLDFESFSTAIPLFDRIRPFEQVPFQFSLQIVRKKGARPEEYGFLGDGTSDPRPDVLGKLRSLLGRSGSIVAYNAQFEKGILEGSCSVFKDFLPWWKKTKRRFVDLLEPLRSFAYYHPKQQGSASIKAVLPLLTGSGYEHLEIVDGMTASLEYLRVTTRNVGHAERERVRKLLEEYCATDTLGMVNIVDSLYHVSKR